MSGEQAAQAEWEEFYRQFGHARYRTAVRLLTHIPSDPRCEACGAPFRGFGGALMRRLGKAPSRKNPRWCDLCFERSPDGGATLTVGVLFADVRGSTSLAAQLGPTEMVDRLNRFYRDTTRVILRHGLVDKLIGDEVMGVYLPALTPGGRFVEAMVADARGILRAVGYGTPAGPHIDVGIGLDTGAAFVGNVGEGEVRDFTVIGDVVNTAARLQAAAGSGEIVLSADVAGVAAVTDARPVRLELKGKAATVQAHVIGRQRSAR